MLFENRKCFELHGYTRTAMEFLESTTHVVKRNSTVFAAFGGPGSCTDTIKDQCISRMHGWIKLVKHIVRAEFPDVELVHAF